MLTIPEWGLLLNSVVAVLVVGYGIWLHNIVDQQMKTKDGAIQALQAALQSKDAEIDRLRAETAPAIAAAYKQVREFADDMAKTNVELTEKTKAQSSEHAANELRKEGLRIATGSITRRLAELPMMFPGAPSYSAQNLLAVLKLIISDIARDSERLTGKKIL